MIDGLYFLLIPWGLLFGFVLALNSHRVWEIFTRDHDDMRFVGFTDSVMMSVLFVPLLFFVSRDNETINFDPITDFVWERVLFTILAIGLGIALAKWAKSEDLV